MSKHVVDPIESALSARPFRASRRVLIATLAASTFVPVICLGVYGYLDYEQRLANANSALTRLSRVAQEQASRILDLNVAMAARTMDVLGYDTRDEIRQHEPLVHRRLEAISADYPQVASLSVFGPAGDLLASSRYSPPPAVAIADRDDFRSAAHWRLHPYLSLPLYRRVDGETILATSIGRSSREGDSLGVISIALRRDYLTDFYENILDDDPGYSVGMYRREGPAMLASSSSDGHLTDLAGSNEFRQAIRENVLYGNFVEGGRGQSKNLLVDFRRVGDYPVYVASAFDVNELFVAWWRRMIVLAAATIIPCALVCTWALFSILRLRTDELAWLRHQQEPDQRESPKGSTAGQRQDIGGMH